MDPKAKGGDLVADLLTTLNETRRLLFEIVYDLLSSTQPGFGMGNRIIGLFAHVTSYQLRGTDQSVNGRGSAPPAGMRRGPLDTMIAG